SFSCRCGISEDSGFFALPLRPKSKGSSQTIADLGFPCQTACRVGDQFSVNANLAGCKYHSISAPPPRSEIFLLFNRSIFASKIPLQLIAHRVSYSLVPVSHDGTEFLQQ